MANPNRSPGQFRPLLPAITPASNRGTPVTDGVPLPKRRRAVRTACDYCRDKKIRCSGEQPCNKCIEMNQQCVFTGRETDRMRQSLDQYRDTLEYIYNILHMPPGGTDEIEIFREIARASPDLDEFVHRVSVIQRQMSGSAGSSRKQSQSTIGDSAKSSFEVSSALPVGDTDIMTDGIGRLHRRISADLADGVAGGMVDGNVDGGVTQVDGESSLRRGNSGAQVDGDEADEDHNESMAEIADFVENQYQIWHPETDGDGPPPAINDE